MNIAKNYFFLKNNLKKDTCIYMKYKKIQHSQFLFYNIPFVCFKTVFTFFVAPPKKKCAWLELFFPYWVV